MSNSTPADLAVAFRSLARRLSEAASEDVPPEAVTKATAAVQLSVSAAARLLDARPTADAVAAAIQDRHTDRWTDDDLATLQACAIDAARAIRDLQAAAS